MDSTPMNRSPVRGSVEPPPHRRIGAWGNGIAMLALLAGLGCASPAGAGRIYLWEGFEREINWAAETDTAATGQVVDSELFTEGGHSLKLLFNASSASARAEFEREEYLDWSPYGAVLFDVYVPDDLPDFRVCMEAETTDKELKHQALSPPWRRDGTGMSEST